MDDTKGAIFGMMLVYLADANELQQLQEQGKGKQIYDFKFHYTVDECHIRAMANIDATWAIIKAMGLEKEYFDYERYITCGEE